jgi:hypothetical protein
LITMKNFSHYNTRGLQRACPLMGSGAKPQ